MLLQMRVLVVEDDDRIAVPLVDGLLRHGFSPTRVTTGAQALAAAETDVVLLDLGLPDVDGIDVCRQLRSRSGVPILVITARGDETDRVIGLEFGADDYMVKPFGFRELVARIRAVQRRAAESPAPAAEPDEQQLGALRIHRRNRRVYVDDVEVALTPKEFDLLALLAEEPGVVVTRQELLDSVWDPHWYGPTKTIDVHVATLRKKLGDRGWIETVRGVGLRLGRPA
ncbi:MAG: two-component system, OmpR family, response regulator RegX3 [Acidimicrobiaceae bacterium]|nr:two-component system, OmpR family, response regulator RegX3 [Acidimicrobiaceae bacterium]